MNVIPLLSKPYTNEVTLRDRKRPLKCCQPLDFLYTSLKGLDFFIPVNIGSVGHRATKLQSVKL